MGESVQRLAGGKMGGLAGNLFGFKLFSPNQCPVPDCASSQITSYPHPNPPKFTLLSAQLSQQMQKSLKKTHFHTWQKK